MESTITSAIEEAGAKAAQEVGLFDEQPVEDKTEESATEEVEAEPGEVVGEDIGMQETKSKTMPMSRFNEIYREKKDLERMLEKVLADQQQLAAAFQQSQQRAIPPPDFESMTNTELVQHLIQQNREAINQAVNTSVMPVASAVRMESLDREIRACQTKHTDFESYREKMIEIANRHPTLSAEETYQLASGNKDAVKKSVTDRVAQMKLKQKAKVETRSSPAAKVSENTQYKNTREAGLAVAKKLGLL